jgi:hypothetical protein
VIEISTEVAVASREDSKQHEALCRNSKHYTLATFPMAQISHQEAVERAEANFEKLDTLGFTGDTATFAGALGIGCAPTYGPSASIAHLGKAKA